MQSRLTHADRSVSPSSVANGRTAGYALGKHRLRGIQPQVDGGTDADFARALRHGDRSVRFRPKADIMQALVRTRCSLILRHSLARLLIRRNECPRYQDEGCRQPDIE